MQDDYARETIPYGRLSLSKTCSTYRSQPGPIHRGAALASDRFNVWNAQSVA